MTVEMIIMTALAVLFFVTVVLVRVMLNVEHELTIGNMLTSLMFAGFAWATMYFASKEASATIAGIVILCFVIGYLTYLGVKEASWWYELLLVLISIILATASIIFAVKTMKGDVNPLLYVIPTVLALIAIAVVLVSFFVYRRKGLHLMEPETLSRASRNAYSLAIFAAIVLMAAATVFVCFQAYSKPASASDGSGGGGDTGSGNGKDYYDVIYYNDLLQDDGDSSNDYNCGPSGDIEDVGATKKEFWIRMKRDPGFASLQLWREDKKCGTKFLKKYYLLYDNTEDAINAAADDFEANPKYWKKMVVKYHKHVKKTTIGYAIRTENVGWRSQAYMNPNDRTPNGRPRIIAMTTNSGLSHLFVQKRKINGVIIEVVTRIDCGYQPMDVVEDGFTITKPDGGSEDPNPPGPGPEIETNPEGPTYNKTTKKAPKENTKPNDEGLGPQTEEGNDPNGSDRMNHTDYRKDMNNKKNINDNQAKVGDPNKPTTQKPSADADVRSNADKGTGYGGVDDAYATYDPTKSGGNTINPQSVDSWGGPTD